MKINLSHGNGSTETSRLIEGVFLKAFSNPVLSCMDDSAIVPIPPESRNIAFTADSFVVKPLFFAGGDIGRLAVCGTVNDLLTAGAKPACISASFIIEQGMEIDDLAEIARSMREAADEAGVIIATGDTKVIEGGGGVYINTSGIGVITASPVNIRMARESDSIIVTGTLGDHHACIVSARMGVKNGIESDVAPLTQIVSDLQKAKIPLNGMRDITRGGLATVLNEITDKTGLSATISEAALPVRESVAGLCEILGLDPLYMGCEGNMLIIIPESCAESALSVIKRSKYGANATVIGGFESADAKRPPRVALATRLGGLRLVPPLSGEGLPRIC